MPAYIIGINQNIQKFSDDGEPSGTAGLPILEIMKAHEVVDAVIVVTRYFGELSSAEAPNQSIWQPRKRLLNAELCACPSHPGESDGRLRHSWESSKRTASRRDCHQRYRIFD